VLEGLQLTPRNKEQQQVIAELFLDLDLRGTAKLTQAEMMMMVCRIIEYEERKTRAQLKAYAKHVGLVPSSFPEYISIFQELDSGDCNALGPRTTKQLMEKYGRVLQPEAFTKFYGQLDTNYSNTLEFPEFLRLLAHLERDKREQEEAELAKEQGQNNKNHKGQNNKKKATPFHCLPPSFEEYLVIWKEDNGEGLKPFEMLKPAEGRSQALLNAFSASTNSLKA